MNATSTRSANVEHRGLLPSKRMRGSACKVNNSCTQHKSNNNKRQHKHKHQQAHKQTETERTVTSCLAISLSLLGTTGDPPGTPGMNSLGKMADGRPSSVN